MIDVDHFSPAAAIGPCTGTFGGRLLQDHCDDCGHALASHRRDRVCSACEAVATPEARLLTMLDTLRAELLVEIHRPRPRRFPNRPPSLSA